jgi:hypothetical protein
MTSRARPPDVPIGLLRLAVEQRGVLTSAQFAAAGVGKNGLRSLWRAGRISPVLRGVWTLPAGPVDPLVRLRAARLAVGGGVACVESAARLYGLPVPAAGHDSVHLSLPPAATRAQPAGVRLHWLETAPDEVHEVFGVPVTTVPRLVLDVTRRWRSRADVVALLDAAYRSHLLSPHDLDLRVSRRAQGWAALADGRAESPLETRVRLLLYDAGLGPLLVPQYEICTEGRVIARLDLAVPSARLGIECDGRDVHQLPEALFRDRRRDDDLRSAGWRILRVTGPDSVRPADFLRRVRRAITDAA